MYPITPQRGNEPSAQGSALGDRTFNPRPERAKAIVGSNAFALTGRWRHNLYTQGVALGYLRAGLSDRLSDTCG